MATPFLASSADQGVLKTLRSGNCYPYISLVVHLHGVDADLLHQGPGTPEQDRVQRVGFGELRFSTGFRGRGMRVTGREESLEDGGFA